MILFFAFFKALPRFAVSPSAFNAGLFLADFRSELRRCGTPQFRSRPWWNALALGGRARQFAPASRLLRTSRCL
jgi:hypothetical protein